MPNKIDLSLDMLTLEKGLLELGVYCYQTSIDFLNKKIDLHIFLDDNETNNIKNHIAEISNQINWIQNNMNYVECELKQCDLIQTKNDYWLDENEDDITPEQFIKRITLLIINIDIRENEIINTNLEYDDNDIFLGHRISVDISNGQVTDINI